MLSVASKLYMLSVVMLNVIMVSVVMLNVIRVSIPMLNVIRVSVVMLNVAAPSLTSDENCGNHFYFNSFTRCQRLAGFKPSTIEWLVECSINCATAVGRDWNNFGQPTIFQTSSHHFKQEPVL
jgi:hypothetical protein